MAELLLSEGANVRARNRWGNTPLHSARNTEVAELLIASGADVNAKDKQDRTPLHRAASLGRTKVAELLIARGAVVDAKDKDGKTPLLLAKDELVSNRGGRRAADSQRCRREFKGQARPYASA